MLYATLQELVSLEIKQRVRLFPVALSNVPRDSTVNCVVCSHDINTQDGNLNCGVNPECGDYTEREKVEVLNLRYFLEEMYPIFVDKESNLNEISNLKIDVEGHEPEVLYPILHLFQQGLIERMFAECFHDPQDAAFF